MKKTILLLMCLFLFSCSEKNPRDYRNVTGKEKEKRQTLSDVKDRTEKKKKKSNCGCPDDSLSFYWNENLILVNKEHYVTKQSNDMIDIKYFLFKRSIDSTEFVELNSFDFYDKIKHPRQKDPHYADSLYHSINNGDVIFFEQLNKNRFFKVKK